MHDEKKGATRGKRSMPLSRTGVKGRSKTPQHARLALRLGVTQLIVAINKMDTAGWSQNRYKEIVTETSGTSYNRENIKIGGKDCTRKETR